MVSEKKQIHQTKKQIEQLNREHRIQRANVSTCAADLLR